MTAVEKLVESLGWILVHSVWQFAVITSVAYVAMQAVGARWAAARYRVLLAALLLIILAPVATAIWMGELDRSVRSNPSTATVSTSFAEPAAHSAASHNAADHAPTSMAPQSDSASAASPATTTSAPLPYASWKRAAETVAPLLPTIVAGWLFGITLFACRPVIGWCTVLQLRSVGTAPVKEAIQKLFDKTVQRLQIRRAVSVLESTRVNVPVVVGCFKPIVLLPSSIISELPASHLEAILAHELAHVRRADNFVNLIQTVVETLFFYHPGIWWLSRQMRIEREHCCDDAVVQELDNRLEYGRALLAMTELQASNNPLVLGANGGSLLVRIRRLCGVEPNRRSWASVLALLLLLVGAGTAAFAWQTTKQQDGESLGQQTSRLWEDARVGTDAAHTQRLHQEERPNAAAPADLRRLIGEWPRLVGLRDWANSLDFTCENGQVGFTWTGTIATEKSAAEATRHADTAMQQLGFRMVAEVKALEAMALQTGMTLKSFRHWRDSNNTHGYRRVANGTTCIVFIEASSYDGGRVASGAKYRWHISRPYDKRQPSLQEAIAVLPGRFRAAYLGKTFYDRLGSEPIRGCSHERGVSIEFVGSTTGKLVRALETEGFEFYQEYEPRPSVQRTWSRHIDRTYAHITTYPDRQRTRFYCQKPQRKPQGIATKAPPRHPVTKLPMSKRPRVRFDAIPFGDPSVRQQARYFHGLAKQMLNQHPDGAALPPGKFGDLDYQDARRTFAPKYAWSWPTPWHVGTSYLKNQLPYRGMALTLEGTHEDGVDEVTSFAANGRYVPATGWGASVTFRSNSIPYVVASKVDPHSIPSVFPSSTSSRMPTLRLSQPSLRIEVRENDDRGYAYFYFEYRTHFSSGAVAGNDGRVASVRRFANFFESPEQLRDTALAALAELRARARQEIPQGQAVRRKWRGPPDERPLIKERSEVPDAIKQQLARLATKELDDRERVVRDEYQQIHAALMKALPIDPENILPIE